jgi:hypothetical protein
MAYLETTDTMNAEKCANLALKSAQEHDERYFEAFSRMLLAQSIVKRDVLRFNEAKQHMIGAIKTLDELKIRSAYAVAIYFLGQTYAYGDQKEIAKRTLEKAEGLFREMGMDYWITRTRQWLASP